MALIKHNKLALFLKSLKEDDKPGLFLIFGEQYLMKQAFQTLSSFLLGKDSDEFALETLEGGSVSMGDIIEQVSTFSFLVSKKIVAVKNIPLFQTQQSNQEVKYTPSDLEHLGDFLKKGIPENHFLILTTTSTDKRKKIYKAINENGLIIDCSVAQGARKADMDEQRSVMQNIAGQVLSKSGKTIDNQAFNSLLELTGFNLDLFSQNLTKLMAYTGTRSAISITDVKAVIIRDKKDPIFSLTNAFMDKNIKKTLFYLDSLFKENFHPLQILKSFENLVRKLILVKCFTQNKNMNLGKINFNSFRQIILPQIINHDKETKQIIEEQNELFTIADPKKKKVKAKSKSNDLFLAPNPQNAYPVFIVFQKSEKFSLNELSQALFFLSDLDYKLKSSSLDAKTQIENFIINICSKGEFIHDSQEH